MLARDNGLHLEMAQYRVLEMLQSIHSLLPFKWIESDSNSVLVLGPKPQYLLVSDGNYPLVRKNRYKNLTLVLGWAVEGNKRGTMKTIPVKLYDRLNREGPQLVTFDETVYSPEEDCPFPVVPWREVGEVGDWVETDDGGKLRVLRITETKMGTWVLTACGEGRIEVEADKIMSTGLYSRGNRFTYSSFVDVDGRQVPTKVRDFCDHLLLTGDPVLAVRLAHPMRTRYIKEEERFPAVLEKQRARDRNRAQAMMRREDVQWYMKRSLREAMTDGGLTPDYLLGRLRSILENETTPSEVARKTALNLLEVWKDNKEESDGAAVGMDAEKLKVIRSKRTSLRKKQKTVGE